MKEIYMIEDNPKRAYIRCLDKDCDGYKGMLWVDRLKRVDNLAAFICPDCKKLIPAVEIIQP